MSIHSAIVTTLALLATIHSAPGPSPKVRDLLRADYDAMLYGKEKNSTVGFSVLVADVNGYGDPIIGAPLADAPKGTREESDLDDVGAVFVTYGGRALPAAIDLSDQFQEAIYGASSNDFFAGLALTKQRAKDSLFGGLANPDIYRKA